MLVLKCPLYEPDGGEQSHEVLSSGPDMAIALVSSQQLQPPAQEWAHQYFIIDGRGTQVGSPLPEKPLSSAVCPLVSAHAPVDTGLSVVK